jgi:hypothetical protein
MRTIVYIFFSLVGHVLPIPSATDKDGEDDELIYWLDKTRKVPFELVSFGSNQIGIHILFFLFRTLVFPFFQL